MHASLKNKRTVGIQQTLYPQYRTQAVEDCLSLKKLDKRKNNLPDRKTVRFQISR